MALARATDPLTIFPRLSLAAQITLPELHGDQPDNLCYRVHIGSVLEHSGWGHPMCTHEVEVTDCPRACSAVIIQCRSRTQCHRLAGQRNAHMPVHVHARKLLMDQEPEPEAEVEVEVGDILKLVGDEGSSLTRSFWFGKFLQLHEDKKIITKHGHPPVSSSSRSKSDTSTLDDNLDSDVKEKIRLFSSADCELHGSHVAEALECLRQYETSLSLNVYNLVVNCPTHSIPAGVLLSISESSFLLKDCTLDWNVVSVHFDKGGVTVYVTIL